MRFWLFKSEPSTWSWEDHCKDGVAEWDGVRNYQARNFMKEMELGDLGFFYQSVKDPQIKGIVEVVKTYYPDPEDTRFGLVDLKAVSTFSKPVTLKEIKAAPILKDLLLLRQSRLSVMPIPEESWHYIVKMGNIISNVKK